MASFQDFIRGLAAASNQWPAAMQARWQRQQAEQQAAAAEQERQRQDVLRRLGIFISAVQGGANANPAPDVAQLLSSIVEHPTGSVPLGEAPDAPGGQLRASPGTEMEQFSVPTAAERPSPWSEVFRPKQEYVRTANGMFLRTPEGLVGPISGTEPAQRGGRRQVVRTANGYSLVDTDTGETDDLEGLSAPPSGTSQTDIDSRAFNRDVASIWTAVAKGDLTKEEGAIRIEQSGSTLGVDPSTIEKAKSALGGVANRLPLSTAARKDLAGYKAVEDIGVQLLQKLEDPKVAAGVGRVAGLANAAKAYLTGNDPEAVPPELLAFWSQFGIYKDNILRAWSGAQINEQEMARISGLLGSTYNDAEGLKIATREMVKNSRDKQAAIYRSAQQQKQGEYPNADRTPGTFDYDIASDADLLERAGQGDEKAQKEAERRGIAP